MSLKITRFIDVLLIVIYILLLCYNIDFVGRKLRSNKYDRH